MEDEKKTKIEYINKKVDGWVRLKGTDIYLDQGRYKVVYKNDNLTITKTHYFGDTKFNAVGNERKPKIGTRVKVTRISTSRPWLLGTVATVSGIDSSDTTDYPVQVKLDKGHEHTANYVWLHKDDDWKELDIGFEDLLSGIEPDFAYFDECVDTDLYCDCFEPDIVKNTAAGDVFEFCRKCKKEKL